jgi:hypothetical protein
MLLLILDDDRTRLRGFDEITSRLGVDWVVKAWRDAFSMTSELDRHLAGAQLISLDHDLYKDSPSDPDPGSGRVVADYLSKRKPTCPVIVHSTNTDAAWGMHNALRAGGWAVELVHHLNQPKWIEELWLPAATRLVAAHRGGRSPVAGAALRLSEYRALVRSLPVPTPLQVRHFAEFVAGAHSWYKHLSLLRANEPLQFFLDPAAGMQHTHAADGSVTAAPRYARGLHYSWLPTAEYRERFGYLAFSKSSGTSVSLQSADGSRQIAADDVPCVYDPAARASYQLPEEALMAGRAFISGVVHELASNRSLWQRLIERRERFDDVLERVDSLELGQRILDRCGVLKEDPSRAEPASPQEGAAFHEMRLAAFDFPLHQLVEAERQRQIEGMSSAAARLVRLVCSRA